MFLMFVMGTVILFSFAFAAIFGIVALLVYVFATIFSTSRY